MTKTHDNSDWICHLHDELCKDEDKDRVYYEKHYGHKPDVLARKLSENSIVYQMSHEMLDHLHLSALAAKEQLSRMVTIEIPARITN